jgi:hypothetical protein
MDRRTEAERARHEMSLRQNATRTRSGGDGWSSGRDWPVSLALERRDPKLWVVGLDTVVRTLERIE